METIKQQLLEACVLFVNDKAQNIKSALASNQNALLNETKSSAGDKHETGRTMLQLEMEKASQQLASVNQMKEVLDKINPKSDSVYVSMGSLVLTDKANYYMAIGAGKINIDKVDYFAVSSQSPIGQQLLGKKVGDQILFNKAFITAVY